MIWLARLFFIIRWPFALPFCLTGFVIAVGIATLTLDVEVFPAWYYVMVRPALIAWPR